MEASSIARETTSSGSVTKFTSPRSRASSDARMREDRIISVARLVPIKRGRRCVPPSQGMNPFSRCVNPKDAAVDATRKSQANAISSPWSIASPFNAATTGLSIDATDSQTRSRSRALASCQPLASSLSSVPAQKMSPLPVSNTAHTSSSCCALKQASAKSKVMSTLISFRCSLRLRVIIATRPSRVRGTLGSKSATGTTPRFS